MKRNASLEKRSDATSLFIYRIKSPLLHFSFTYGKMNVMKCKRGNNMDGQKSLSHEGQTRICAHCGATFHGHFCPDCGTKVEEEITFCPVCGTDRTPGKLFCHNCGFSYISDKKPDASPTAAPTPVAPAPVEAPTPVKEEQTPTPAPKLAPVAPKATATSAPTAPKVAAPKVATPVQTPGK